MVLVSNISRVSVCIDVPVFKRMSELYRQMDRDRSFANAKCRYRLVAYLSVLCNMMSYIMLVDEAYMCSDLLDCRYT